jgi:predicted ATPase
VQLKFQGERQTFAEHLVSLKTKVRSEVLQGLASEQTCTPRALGEALLVGAAEVEKRYKLSAAQSSALADRISVADKFRLQELVVPDKVTMELNLAEPGETPNYRSIDRLSIGQKATTILLILLTEETKPLVIDQPESDLDNRFIVKDVVDRIRTVKDSRQLIVATHNANIPVLGDAESIVVLDAEESGGRAVGQIVDQGSIDSKPIKDAVNLILEGGSDAFRLRQEKYGVPIP